MIGHEFSSNFLVRIKNDEECTHVAGQRGVMSCGLKGQLRSRAKEQAILGTKEPGRDQNRTSMILIFDKGCLEEARTAMSVTFSCVYIT